MKYTYLIVGIVILLFSIWERIHVEGPHFGGVYGIIIGAGLIFEGVRGLWVKKNRGADLHS